MEERNIRRDLRNAAKFAEITASITALENNKRIIRATISSEGDKQKFEELLEIGQEYIGIMEKSKNKLESFDIMEALEKLEIDKVQLKVNYILKVLQQEYIKLDDKVETAEKTFNEKMQRVLKEGARLADGRDSEEVLEEAKQKSPIAFFMMETMKKLALEFAKEIQENNVRVIVPVSAITEKPDFDKVRLALGEGEEESGVALEEALKTVSRFLPLIIQAELQQSFRARQAREKGEGK